MTERAQRRLAAVVSADVAGYSRLMGSDERGTLAALKAHRAELIDDAIASHGGRIVKTTGDGMLAEFPSVVDAVECCVAVQEGMAKRNDGVADDAAIRFRIGIHLGDIIVDGDDIFGDGVNVAARLQELGEPGGIAVSAVVHDYLDSALAAGFADLGERELKNIRRPVRIWQRASETRASKPLPTELPLLALPSKPSIAVLPFDNMSGDPKQDYFADGVTEEIIAALARYAELHVIARNSTFAYKSQAADVRQIGRELGAGYVLEGSVRGGGHRIRVTAQLVDATNGSHLWSERYDRPLDDIFDLQDEIAALVASTAASEVRQEGMRQAVRRPAVTLTAWDLHAQAFWHIDRPTREGTIKAQELCRRALELAPDYMHAYVTLTLACNIEAIALWSSRPRDELTSAAEAAARSATDLEPSSYLAHKALGNALFVAGQHESALREHEMAIRINPYDPHNHGQMGLTLAYMGPEHYERAAEHLRRSIALSPNDRAIAWWLSAFSAAEFIRGDYEQGIAWARNARQHNQHLTSPLVQLAVCHAMKGNLSEAQEAVVKLPQSGIKFDLANVRGRIGPLFYRHADFERFLEGLRRAGVSE